MKNLLTTTALVAVSATAVMANQDNFKVQLDNISRSFQCEAHFDKDAADIATKHTCLLYTSPSPRDS